MRHNPDKECIIICFLPGLCLIVTVSKSDNYTTCNGLNTGRIALHRNETTVQSKEMDNTGIKCIIFHIMHELCLIVSIANSIYILLETISYNANFITLIYYYNLLIKSNFNS